MNLLKSDSGYPLRSSLFWKDSGVYMGTWDFLARDTVHLVDKALKAQVSYNSQLFTFMCFNMVEANNHPVNPFKGCPTADVIAKRLNSMQDVGWDDAEVKRWDSILPAIGNVPGVFLVPTIFCGDDKATTQNETFVNAFSTTVVRVMHPYVAGYNISSEATKTMDTGRMNRMIANMRAAFEIEPKLAPKPITAHIQWRPGQAMPDVDFLMYEFRKNPWNANEYSPSDVVREAKKVLAAYPGQVWFQELAVRHDEGWARKQVRALRDLAKTEPRIIGLPGPV